MKDGCGPDSAYLQARARQKSRVWPPRRPESHSDRRRRHGERGKHADPSPDNEAQNAYPPSRHPGSISAHPRCALPLPLDLRQFLPYALRYPQIHVTERGKANAIAIQERSWFDKRRTARPLPSGLNRPCKSCCRARPRPSDCTLRCSPRANGFGAACQMEDLNLLLICACESGTDGRRDGQTDAKAHRDRAERRVRASALALVLALYLAGAAHYFFPALSARSG